MLIKHLAIPYRLCANLKIPAYLNNASLLHLKTTVQAISSNSELRFANTIIHPQGGGQPTDLAHISHHNSSPIKIVGAFVDKQTGHIWNKLDDNKHEFKVGDTVQINIDRQSRNRNTKLHSAGHIIDLAVQNLKYAWEVGKGYHFPDKPYVQYKGGLTDNKSTHNQLNQQLQRILSSQTEIVNQVYSYEQAVTKQLIPENFKVPYVRIISFADSSCPCGGTHISTIQQLKSINVTKLQKKGKYIRVYYQIQ